MRIETTARSSSVMARSGISRGGTGSGFFVTEDAPLSHAAATAPTAPTAGIDALLALQAVDDPLLARKKAVRRGSALLDALSAAQADLLTGSVGESRLNQMMALVSQARESVDPRLDALIDDIELRVRVELAKHGRYPA
jgi:hypothetical protein